MPISLEEVPQLLASGRLPIDVALLQVSPPDVRGYVSLGVSVDLAPAVLSVARRVIAEVNPAMPRTRGESFVHLGRFDALVNVDTPVAEYRHPETGEIAERVARYIASIIDDGSTLQIGLGRVPNEALRHLRDRRDIGIHTDVITDGIMDLVEAGVVTGRRKTRHHGRIVASYCLGTRRLYDFIDDNPRFLFLPIDQICDPEEVAANPCMVSISQAFAIDLTGQVCVDQFEGQFYGGVSTQAAFIRGAARSPGGKPIICLASTTDDGASRIKPQLEAGDGVGIARSDVHYAAGRGRHRVCKAEPHEQAVAVPARRVRGIRELGAEHAVNRCDDGERQRAGENDMGQACQLTARGGVSEVGEGPRRRDVGGRHADGWAKRGRHSSEREAVVGGSADT